MFGFKFHLWLSFQLNIVQIHIVALGMSALYLATFEKFPKFVLFRVYRSSKSREIQNWLRDSPA